MTAMDVDAPAIPKEVTKKSDAPVDPNVQLANDIKTVVGLVRKSVTQFEPRFLSRALRNIPCILRRVSAESIAQTLESNVSDQNLRSALLKAVEKAEGSSGARGEGISSTASGNNEVDLFVGYLTFLLLQTQSPSQVQTSLELVEHLLQRALDQNKRTLDPLTARFIFWRTRLAEQVNKLDEFRPFLLNCLRTCTLRRDTECQAVIMNCLLRSYLHYNLYDQADKLIRNTTFPENVGNSEWARFLLYKGRVEAINLNYTDAQQSLQNAERKAPAPKSNGSYGFLLNLLKIKTIVDLLMGEIAPKAVYNASVPVPLREALEPYSQLVSAVRRGDLSSFSQIISKHEAQFKADKVLNLIHRLRHNVLKTGIRMISQSYSRISLRDICVKLHVDSEEDAEFVVTKAIKDGVIDATIDHEKGFMKSTETRDVYSTREPQDAFHQRINVCLQLHNDAVKALRYPANVHKKELETAQELRERANELKKIGEDDIMGGADEDEDDDGDAEF